MTTIAHLPIHLIEEKILGCINYKVFTKWSLKQTNKEFCRNLSNIENLVFPLSYAIICKLEISENYGLSLLRQNIVKHDKVAWANKAASEDWTHFVKEMFEKGGEYASAVTSLSTWAICFVHGNIKILDYLYKHSSFHKILHTEGIEIAAANGKLDVVKWLVQHCLQNCLNYCDCNAIDYAAKNGNIEIVKYLHFEKIGKCTPHAIDMAAKNGNLKVIQWLYENCMQNCTKKAKDLAAKFGHLDTLKWLSNNTKKGCTHKAIDLAATNGHLDVIKWLYENKRVNCTELSIEMAAKNGHIHVIKWLFKKRMVNFTEKAFRNAIKHEHQGIAQYLNEIRNSSFMYKHNL